MYTLPAQWQPLNNRVSESVRKLASESVSLYKQLAYSGKQVYSQAVSHYAALIYAHHLVIMLISLAYMHTVLLSLTE